MNRILSLIVTILFALCIEAGIFMLIAHWWGMTAAITVIAIECVLALWTVYDDSSYFCVFLLAKCSDLAK